MAEKATTPTGVQYTDFHADTPESMKNEKRAILALMAEMGTEGQIEYERARRRAIEARNRSVEIAAARGMQIGAPSALQAELNADYDKLVGPLMDNLVAAQTGHGREMDRIQAANAAYLDQISRASQLNRDLIAAQIGAAAGGGGGGGGGRGTRTSSTTQLPTDDTIDSNRFAMADPEGFNAGIITRDPKRQMTNAVNTALDFLRGDAKEPAASRNTKKPRTRRTTSYNPPDPGTIQWNSTRNRSPQAFY